MNIDDDSVDTSSIIENKETTKEYWERRMMAEQGLIVPEKISKFDQQTHSRESSSKLILGKVSSTDSKGDTGYQLKVIDGKLGSDGESEASPESSLSPVDVDSLEEAVSEGRTSPELEGSSESDHQEEKGRDCDLLLISSVPPSESDIEMKSDLEEGQILETLNPITSQEVALLRFEALEREELSTVIEEEQEPDSLEEFIKHENECMTLDEHSSAKNKGQDKALLAPEKKEEVEEVEEEEKVADEAKVAVNEKEEEEVFKEVLYEEISISPDDDRLLSSKSKEQTPSARSCPTAELALVDLEPELDTLSGEAEAEASKQQQIALLSMGSVVSPATDLKKDQALRVASELPAEVLPEEISPGLAGNDLPKPQIIGGTLHPETLDTSAEKEIVKEKMVADPIVSGIKPVLEEMAVKPSAESKIAQEIQEQKKREEELKKLREEMNALKASESEPTTVETSKGVPDEVEMGRASPSTSEMSTTDSYCGRVSVDSLASSRDSCCSASSNKLNRLDRIKVRPYAEQETEAEPIYRVLTESPIEREIRVTREREDELRKEKGLDHKDDDSLRTSPSTNRTTSVKVLNATGESPNKLPLFRQNSVTNVTDIQKILATTRIQQEIEEQTQREMALRASGSIKTISHERSDAKVTRLGDMDKTDSNGYFRTLEENGSTSTSTSVPTPTPTPIPTPTPTLTPIQPQSQNPTPIKSATPATAPAPAPVTPPALCAPATPVTIIIKSSSETTVKPFKVSSPEIITKSVKKSTVSPIYGVIGPNKSISMHRFISSKGKAAIGASSFAGLGNTTGSKFALDNEYQDMKPPQILKGDRATLRKGAVPAESKIQEELKEMKAREEELKRHRARLLGLSQPNINLLVEDSCHMSLSLTPESPSLPLKRTNSNPSLSNNGQVVENGHQSEAKDIYQPGSTRKRSALIAKWEQKIQQESH